MPELFFLEEISGSEINPYEAVTLASREARRINQTRQMVEISEGQEKPTTLALKRLAEKKVRLVGEGEAEEIEEGGHGTSKPEADTAGR